ncbi:VOC family protein [Pseudoalteromonas piratica]|nr:VOC family protein [Pseudoalteromonas piratica]
MVKLATLLVVNDLKISKNFYENILGLEISESLRLQSNLSLVTISF